MWIIIYFCIFFTFKNYKKYCTSYFFLVFNNWIFKILSEPRKRGGGLPNPCHATGCRETVLYLYFWWTWYNRWCCLMTVNVIWGAVIVSLSKDTVSLVLRYYNKKRQVNIHFYLYKRDFDRRDYNKISSLSHSISFLFTLL